MKTILAPLDFSIVTRSVVAQAVALARAVDGRVVLLHVLPRPPRRLKGGAPGNESGEEFLSTIEQATSARLALLQEELRSAGVAAHAIRRRGNPGQCIVQQAERLSADYIVIGSHGHTAIYDLIVGSTTTRVLKGAGCRVVIIPPALAGGGTGEPGSPPAVPG